MPSWISPTITQAPCHSLAVLVFLCNYNRLGVMTGRAVGGAGPSKYIFSMQPSAQRDEKMRLFKPIRRSGTA
jgi:hypothetical protein